VNRSINFRRWLYALVVLLVIIAALYLSGWVFRVAQAGSDILALYFFAWLVQFFFTPVVDFLARRGVPRLLAVSYVYVVVGLAAVVLLIAAVPPLYSQAQHLAGTLGNKHTYTAISTAAQGIEKLVEQKLHVPPSTIQEFTKNYGVSLQNGAFKAGAKLQQLLSSHLTPSNLSTSATTFLSFLGTLNTLLLNVVIVLILAFYMMLDGHKLVRQVLAYFPPAVDEVMEEIHLIINRKFGGYLRGQVILALSYGLLTYLIAVGFGLSYSVLLAVMAAVLMLIPFIGAFAAIVPPLVAFVLMHLATTTAFPVLRFALLFVFLVVAQHIVINLLAPRVMSSAMGMHPLLVLLGLLLGAKLGGLWGAIFGVPVLGVALDTVDVIYRRVMRHRSGFQPLPVTTGDGEDKTGRGPAPAAPGIAVPQRRHHRRPDGLPRKSRLRRLGATLRPRACPGDTHGTGPVG
jgi:predicted PurR-regulated permease PerM